MSLGYIESSDINSSLVICVFAFMTIKDALETKKFLLSKYENI